jgi:RES domain-containing protein
LKPPAVLWRISNHRDLAGLDGEKTNGRWHTAARGKRIVYLSEHPAVALIEALANLKGNPHLFPTKYQLIRIGITDGVHADSISEGSLAGDWRDRPDGTRSAGDDWLARANSALLAVPSAPSPESLNYLLNPLHPEATGLRAEWSKWVVYDQRLFRVRV